MGFSVPCPPTCLIQVTACLWHSALLGQKGGFLPTAATWQPDCKAVQQQGDAFMNVIKNLGTLIGVASLFLVMSCGKVNDAVTETKNETRIEGHWLMNASEHTGEISKLAEKESVVLTFKDGKAGFSPTDSIKGQTVYAAAFDECLQKVRAYNAEKNQFVFPAVDACPEIRVTVQQLDDKTLKFPDFKDNNITRVFERIDENRYQALVKKSDQKP